MAQELQSVSLLAPAFLGLNTQESPIQLEPSYATVADNCVIDKSGRLAARKGREALTTDNTPLAGGEITAMMEFIDNTGAVTFLSTGGGKIFSGTTVLTDITPASYTITADDWQIASFNNAAYFFQKNHEPLVYSGGTLSTISSLSPQGSVPYGNTVLAAYGRLWVADEVNDNYTLHFTDLLNGLRWAGGGGSAGFINLRNAWPRGYDEVVAIKAHNDFLIIFGKESILLYQGAEDPGQMELVDTIVDVGCIARDSVKVIGTDLLFLSQEGVRSLGRTIQEKSVGIGDISANVKDDIIGYIQAGAQNAKATFAPADNLYLLSFPDSQMVYAFDTRGRLENGAMRTTRWPQLTLTSLFCSQDSTLYIGTSDGICLYDTYDDNGDTFTLKYESPILAFGDDARLKFIKRIRGIFSGGGGGTQATMKWAYGFDKDFKTKQFTLNANAGGVAYYNISEYGIGEYSQGVEPATTRVNINGTGSGALITLGVDASINGYAFGIQSINLQTLIGKLI